MKIYAVSFLVLFFISPLSGYGFSIGELVVHGPANCRDLPNGKILTSLAHKDRIKYIDKKEDWFLILFKKTKCWTHEKNVLEMDVNVSCPVTYTGPSSGYVEFNEAVFEKLPSDFQSASAYSSSVPLSYSNCNNTNLFICHYGTNPKISLKAKCDRCKEIKSGDANCTIQKSSGSEQQISKPTKYVEIRLDQPYVYGNFNTASQNQLEIKELLNLECFYVFDYGDEVTHIELDSANTKKLPWCEDPSGGTLLKPTGKMLVYEFDEKSHFSLWNLAPEKPKLSLSKEVFIKRINESKGELIKLKVRKDTKNIIDTIETVYTD
jgi:hypothetical protein